MTSHVTSDADAWDQWPHHRKWFNKLDLSMRLGYVCGPCGTGPPVSGYYVVRPIYNLSGMGAGASKNWITERDRRSVPAGYFWCEWFDGRQYSVTYTWDAGWIPVSSWMGVVHPDNLSRFEKWVRSDVYPQPPSIADELSDVGLINIEWIGDKVIEVHLRPSPDPDVGKVLVPVWADSNDVVSIASFDDADGNLKVPRIGFKIQE